MKNKEIKPSIINGTVQIAKFESIKTYEEMNRRERRSHEKKGGGKSKVKATKSFVSLLMEGNEHCDFRTVVDNLDEEQFEYVAVEFAKQFQNH